jgi:hypothetical protein
MFYVWSFGLFYGHLGYFMTIWYILCSFGAYFLVLVSCTKKNLATLFEAGNGVLFVSLNLIGISRNWVYLAIIFCAIATPWSLRYQVFLFKIERAKNFKSASSSKFYLIILFQLIGFITWNPTIELMDFICRRKLVCAKDWPKHNAAFYSLKRIDNKLKKHRSQ